jgi:ribonuclease HII
VRIDKQGGRDNYLPVLEGCIGGASFLPVVEGSEESRYVIEHGDRRMVLHFALRSDAAYLPVTLAGIVAKYSRELLMRQQNEWFSARQPGLGQTAGYPLDARRWLQDSLAVRRRLGVADALLIRNR